MKKVFLDTNILMDFVENREKREYAETIIELGKTGVIQLFASYLSFANMGYILRKRQQEERYRMIRNARKIVIVLPCDVAQLDRALTNPVKDYEDMYTEGTVPLCTPMIFSLGSPSESTRSRKL